MEFHSMEDSLFKQIEKAIEEKEKTGVKLEQEKIDEMVEKMYSPEMINQFSDPLYESLINQAPTMYEEHRLEQQEFEARLQMKWLDAFYGLKSVITISEEIGTGLIDEFLENSKKDDGTSFVPLEYDIAFKLHGKSVVVSKEILTLLQSGYSDAAISRWRTLHEISVILSLITDTLENNTDLAKELAIRFYNRSIVEEFKIEKIDNKRNSDEFISLKAQVEEIKNNYGEKFIYEDYEWARPVLPQIKGRIYFSNLEKKTGNTKLTSYYKMANNQIHSTSFGLYKSFGDMYDSGIGVIFGPSNYGLSIPGQLTIISIIRSTSSLLTVDSTLDKMMIISVLQKFFERYSSVFDDIQTRIEREEEEMKKEE
ncbi:MAG: hypothetical protein E7153_10250 [Enterococcus faecium]|uniref:Uncharacterized protein n=2 Tax=Enterococcus mundtii TaxID=53346 RepID=A0A2T5DBC7_ENTMU|nr:hypothetical protein [Enterococcus faecium]PTO34785.1 hypothetical protein C6N14_10640 [Enterococcus mundtii]